MTGKKKRPPTFQFLPKPCARRLKQSWVQDHKIRRKWKAQKKREGLTSHTTPVEDQDDTEDTCPNPPPPTTNTAPSQSLRDLRKIAYTKPKADRGGKATESGQPNMTLRMNVLLEKIKRDFP